ncbi:Zn-dependent hydrolase [Vibrio sp.]|uniref:Zn-dependent hydrolase n=1 Tax=Vibrio sp. TaxID=678 RepID=UPI003D0B6628
MTAKVNQNRLWDCLEEHGQIGSTGDGGVNRETLTEADKVGRDTFIRWCEDAGMSVEIDRLGNIFATRPGLDNSLLPVAMGSHLDTQPTGGKYDGILGVLGGLEVVRALNEANITTRRPIQIVVWTNEEGSRFLPSMAASGVYAGIFKEEDILAETDDEGVSFADALDAIGYRGSVEVGKRKFHAFIELHIEQGPVLEHKKMEVGVVTGSQAMNWSNVTVRGIPAHAGTTPMPNRTDALACATRLLQRAYDEGNAMAGACTTIGVMNAYPSSHSTIPNRVEFTLDLRHPDPDKLAELVADFDAVAAVESRLGFEITREEFGIAEAQVFDKECTAAIRRAAEQGGYRYCDIVSGAGHDAVYLNQVCPTGMIFVPCKDGVSHNPKESITAEQATAGVDVMLNAVLELANKEGVTERDVRLEEPVAG